MLTGEQIRKARQAKEMTQAALAAELGVSSEAVSKWEKNGYSPSPENEEQLYRILGLSRRGRDREDVVIFDERNMSAFLKGKFNSGNFPEASRALTFAKEKHEGQLRKPKELKIPYINHPLTLACHAMAMGLEEDGLLAALLLHDVCEESGVAPEELPVSTEVQQVVALVTKPKPFLNEKLYYSEIAKNPRAAMVKCLDRCNNLSGMVAAFSVEGLQDYIEETERYYPELLRTIKEQPEYNNAAWLLKYQIGSLLLTAKRITV